MRDERSKVYGRNTLRSVRLAHVTASASLDSCAEGYPHEVHGGASAERTLEPRAIVGDGLVGNVQLVGYLSHGAASGQQMQDFEFPSTEIGNRVGVSAGTQECYAPRHLGITVTGLR